MKEKREDAKHEARPAKRNRPRSKQIATDFTRVEDLGTMPAMAPFELETRKIIAERSMTPLDDLIAAEVNCFNPFQPEVMDVKSLMSRYRGRDDRASRGCTPASASAYLPFACKSRT